MGYELIEKKHRHMLHLQVHATHKNYHHMTYTGTHIAIYDTHENKLSRYCITI